MIHFTFMLSACLRRPESAIALATASSFSQLAICGRKKMALPFGTAISSDLKIHWEADHARMSQPRLSSAGPTLIPDWANTPQLLPYLKVVIGKGKPAKGSTLESTSTPNSWTVQKCSGIIVDYHSPFAITKILLKTAGNYVWNPTHLGCCWSFCCCCCWGWRWWSCWSCCCCGWWNGVLQE